MKSIKNYEENKQNETTINTSNNNNNINKKKEDLILNLEKEIESILINLYNNRYIK